ncbi:MAG TPA: TonB-dependent receptor [Pyrinomonadaceae bacterium]|nr:TonB-dependent receptor [Pyrinomonadaceae bacterium]
MKNYSASRLVRAALLAFALAASFAAPTFAQEETAATVSGQVTDSTGAVVPAATVVVTNTETGIERRVESNEDGLYSVSPLPPGPYQIVIEQSGFKRYVQTDLVLNAKDRRLVNIVLEAGNLSEVITVTAEEAGVLDSPTTQALISGTQVVELPLNNRNFLKLTELVPGVSSSLDDESTFGLTSRADISINGMRRNSVNYFVDGVSNTDVGSNITLLSTPTIDSIQEFKVLSSNYTAEIGRSGGGVVTVVTRGGGNDFHGSLYEFLRNDYFNANTFFNNRTPRRPNGDVVPTARTPKLRYNNFGGTISGPVYLPRFGEGGPAYWSGKNRTFFFFSQETRRIIRGATEAGASTITAAQRGGDFSGILGLPLFRATNNTSCTTPGTGTCTNTPLTVTDTGGNVIQARAGMVFRPTDGRAYVGNIIPASDLSPLAQSLLPAFPLPNSGVASFTSTPININHTRQESVRIDHAINDNHRLFGRYTHDLSQTQESGGLFNNILFPNISTTDTRVPGHVLAISLTSVLSPSFVNEATYNFSGNLIGSELTGRGRRSDYPGSEAIPENFPENNNDAIPELNFTGNNIASRLASLQGFNIKYTNHVFRDVATWTRGSHTFKFGGEISFEAKDENANNLTGGSFTFDSVTTRGTSGGVALTQTGSAIASFLLGRAAGTNPYLEDQIDVTVNLRFGRRELFAQDTWKIRPNLTLDYGVRWQYFVPVTDKNNILTSFDPTLYSPAAVPTCTTPACTALVRGTGNELNGIAVAGSTSRFGDSIYPSDKNNFSPRVGLAWDPFSDGNTIIRAGYGFYYDQPLVGIFEQNAFVNPPYNNRAVFTGAGVTLATPTGGALGSIPIRNLIANAPDFETPEIQQWSVGIQRELFRNAVIDVSYVGTKGDKLIRQRNINLPLPSAALAAGGTTVGGNRNTVRPFIGYGTINYRETSAISRYHGLLSAFNYRFGNGFTVTTAYTWSKTLTDATNDRDGIDDPQNPFDIRPNEYALARTDRPHVFSASYVYEIPFFSNDPSTAKRLLLGGWQISGITTIASGQPFPRVLAATNNETRGGRAELVGDPLGGVTGTNDPSGLPFFFNPAAFALPADGTFGDSARAFGRRPGQNQTNLSAIKNFYFNRDKDVYLQFRAEGFNIFNHTQFLMNDTNSFSLSVPGSLGRPTSTRLPREFQFGLKLYF